MGIGGSLHTVFGWRGQYERILRWHRRVCEYPATVPSSAEADEYLDFLLAFFLNCFSLRDWLDNSQAATKTELDTLFENNPDLKICRDICNGAKHFEIRRPSVDPELSIVRDVIPDPYFGRNAYPGKRLIIYAGDQQRDLRELATSCVDAWRLFLISKGLIDAAA